MASKAKKPEYLKKRFAKELREQLCLGYDIKRISRWAFDIHFKYCDRFEPGLRDTVMEISTMEEGFEFEMSEDELFKLAKDLEKT